MSLTYGYLTKYTRIKANLEKTHSTDSYCIAGNINARLSDTGYKQKFVRRHNRQIHKATISKGKYRKANQAPKYVYRYQLFDKVLCNGRVGFIFGRRSSGSFDVRTLDGERINAGISYKKLTPLEKRSTLLKEQEERHFLPMAGAIGIRDEVV